MYKVTQTMECGHLSDDVIAEGRSGREVWAALNKDMISTAVKSYRQAVMKWVEEALMSIETSTGPLEFRIPNGTGGMDIYQLTAEV